MNTKRVYHLAGLMIVSLFVLSFMWEFVLEEKVVSFFWDHHEPEPFKERIEYVIASTVMAVVAVVFALLVSAPAIAQRKRTEALLRVRAKQQAAIADLGCRALAGADLVTLLEEAVRLIAKILEVEYCKVLKLLPGGDAFLLRAGVGWKEGYVGSATLGAERDSQAGYTLLSDEPVIVEDLRTETRFSGPPLLREHGVVSGLSVIIEGETQPFGVLGAHTSRHRKFTSDDINFVQAIANVLAAGIERKQAEEGLQESGEKLRLIMDNISDGIITADEGGIIRSFNAAAERIFGYAAHEMIGRNLTVLMTKPDQERHHRYIKRYLDTGEAKIIGIGREVTGQRNGGACFPMDLRIGETVLQGQRLFIGSVRDITARKRAELALQESEARLRAITSAFPDLALVADEDGRLIEVLASPTNYVYPGAESPTGRLLKEILPTRQADGLLEIVRRTLATGLPQTLVYDLDVGDETRWFEARTAPVEIFADGKPTVVVVSRDITERKSAEEKLLQSEKMNALGNLAGGIAHDFNNLLVPVMGLTEMTADALPADSQGRKNLRLVFIAASRAKDLVRKILAFSRSTQPGRHPLALHDLVGEVVSLLRSTLPATVEIIEDLDPDAGTVLAEPTEIHQVLMNLASNAAHAMNGKGKLGIGLDRIKVFEGAAQAKLHLKPGSYVRLRVTDTGCGMDKATQQRVLDPFFTTKPVGEGTGMGLAMVHGIVTSCGGDISVSSAPGQGATFDLHFPLWTRAETAPTTESEANQDIPGTATVSQAGEGLALGATKMSGRQAARDDRPRPRENGMQGAKRGSYQ